MSSWDVKNTNTPEDIFILSGKQGGSYQFCVSAILASLSHNNMAAPKGHTFNLGKKMPLATAKRLLKRREKREQEALLNSVKPEDVKIRPHSQLTPFQKGHVYAGGGKPKKTGSIKEKIIYELKKPKSIDTLEIARKLINMAKAGDLRAIELLMDRVDGKVPSTVGGDKENPLVVTVESVLSAKYSNKKDVNRLTDNNRAGQS